MLWGCYEDVMMLCVLWQGVTPCAVSVSALGGGCGGSWVIVMNLLRKWSPVLSSVSCLHSQQWRPVWGSVRGMSTPSHSCHCILYMSSLHHFLDCDCFSVCPCLVLVRLLYWLLPLKVNCSRWTSILWIWNRSLLFQPGSFLWPSYFTDVLWTIHSTKLLTLQYLVYASLCHMSYRNRFI